MHLLRFEKAAITPGFQQFPFEPSTRDKTAPKLRGSRDALRLPRSFVPADPGTDLTASDQKTQQQKCHSECHGPRSAATRTATETCDAYGTPHGLSGLRQKEFFSRPEMQGFCKPYIAFSCSCRAVAII